MPKNLFQDMVKINQTRRPVRNVAEERVQRRDMEEWNQSNEFETNAPRVKNRLWIPAVLAVLFFLFALSYFFASAEINIEPKTRNHSVSDVFSAEKEAVNTRLGFELVVLSGEESRAISSFEEKEVAYHARGTVLIYNAFSSAPQKLDIDTRLEGSNGKIYKTEKALTVPGMKGGVPGSVEVGVYASEPGPEYNSEPLDFKIVGFKGGPKYEKFYARSKDALSGGFEGVTKVANEEDRLRAIFELKNSLRASLLEKAKGQIPKEFILFDDVSVFESEVVENLESGEVLDVPPVRVRGTLFGVLLREESLSQAITESLSDEYKESDVYVANIRDLKIELVPSQTPLKELNTASFKITGMANVVWRVDEDDLRTELLGKRKSDFHQILSGNPVISSANISLSPVWNRSIPDDPEKIKIIVNYPE